MAADPFVLGICKDDLRQFGQPVYAVPDYDQSEMPIYSHDELLTLQAPEESEEVMAAAIKRINNRTLAAELHRYRCLCQGYEAADSEVNRRIELKYRIAAERARCIVRLQMANAHERLAAQLDPRGFGEVLARAQGGTRRAPAGASA